VETGRKVVLVASGSSPDRAIALERLLGAAADRSGWGERLEIRLGGINGGAGRISDAGLAALKGLGIDAAGAVCPDLDRRPSLLEGAAVVICDRGDVADTLVDWTEAGEAEFVCVNELGEVALNELGEVAVNELGKSAANRGPSSPKRGKAAVQSKPKEEDLDDSDEPDDAAIEDEVHDFEDRIDEVLRRIVSTAPA